MKIITERQHSDLVEVILKEYEKQSEKLGKPFDNIGSDELQRKITERLGGSWGITSEQPVKFTKADINAVAGARYFRKGGITMLMGLAILLLLLAVITRSLIVMTPLYYNLYYTLCGLIALGFIWLYSKQLAKIRRQLWRQLGRKETEEK